MIRLATVMGLMAITALMSPAGAQTYPTRVIKIVVPYPAGGTSELLGRALAKKISEDFGEPVSIDNVAGAAGAIGAARVASAPADGYTLLFGYATQFTISPAIRSTLPYDPVKSFIPIGGVARFSFLITANARTPIKTLKDLVDDAKQQPGKLTYASPGVGTSTHMLGELMKLKYGIDIVHVPYRGGSDAINDYVAGRITVYWDAVAPLLQWVQNGTIVPLAVTSEHRLPVLPEVPTVAEAGMPELESSTWTALFAPAGTPAEVVQKLQGELGKCLEDTSIQALYAQNFYEIYPKSGAEITSVIESETAKWRAVASAAGVKLD